MKKIIASVALPILLISLLFAGDDLAPMQRRMEALAIGEITLAYRLIALAASLSIAAATDNDAILGLLENVEGTLGNGKLFLGTQDPRGAFAKDILLLVDETLLCASKVKEYTKNKNYENLQKIRSCIDPLEEKISGLTERFNKAPSHAPPENPAATKK